MASAQPIAHAVGPLSGCYCRLGHGPLHVVATNFKVCTVQGCYKCSRDQRLACEHCGYCPGGGKVIPTVCPQCGKAAGPR